MKGIIQKWGNSQGIRIPKTVLKSLNLKQNDSVEIITNQDTIIIKKLNNKKHLTLEERLKNFNGEYNAQEVDWGKPKGKEIW